MSNRFGFDFIRYSIENLPKQNFHWDIHILQSKLVGTLELYNVSPPPPPN